MASHFSILNPMNSMKRQNDRILKEELPRSVGAQYVNGDQWRNNSGKNEGMEPKQKQYPVVDLASITSHIHGWVSFLCWLHPFILLEFFLH